MAKSLIAKVVTSRCKIRHKCQSISIETFLKQFKGYQKVLTIFIQLCEKYLKIRPLKQRFYLISYPYTAISIGILLWKYENMLLLFTSKIGQWAIWIRVPTNSFTKCNNLLWRRFWKYWRKMLNKSFIFFMKTLLKWNDIL